MDVSRLFTGPFSRVRRPIFGASGTRPTLTSDRVAARGLRRVAKARETPRIAMLLSVAILSFCER
jgi:hypothetical protein